jgi:hypothetical protein
MFCGRCDNITISPALLDELQASTEALPRKLWPTMGGSSDALVSGMSQAAFDDLHGSDEMAVEKLKHVSGWLSCCLAVMPTQHCIGCMYMVLTLGSDQ